MSVIVCFTVSVYLLRAFGIRCFVSSNLPKNAKTMKTQIFAGLSLLYVLASCEKSTELDPQALQLELESCKVKKKDLAVGMEYGGGIIFFLDETGKHGLIAAKEDLGPAPWGCYGTSIPGLCCESNGQIASKMILQECKEPGIAARLCARYSACDQLNPSRVYRDWHLPSQTELRNALTRRAESGYQPQFRVYWTTEEAVESNSFRFGQLFPETHAWAWEPLFCADEKMCGLWPHPNKKSYAYYVLPIRNF